MKILYLPVKLVMHTALFLQHDIQQLYIMHVVDKVFYV